MELSVNPIPHRTGQWRWMNRLFPQPSLTVITHRAYMWQGNITANNSLKDMIIVIPASLSRGDGRP
ncbi:hypothetical protein COMA2_150079 [Candidatus Nitrospira nitrificans]|uniref:Uncharacterized protein n=1 Tax=Candidatus Nitrospira nitrificans TaxID=1742973 RepID=A0A0S4LBS5_9BACT|nr:hypothetical protein COMA2_150079 [Candidatus Nitrospira nitrificans]